jgi:hypothetical protein
LKIHDKSLSYLKSLELQNKHMIVVLVKNLSRDVVCVTIERVGNDLVRRTASFNFSASSKSNKEDFELLSNLKKLRNFTCRSYFDHKS